MPVVQEAHQRTFEGELLNAHIKRYGEEFLHQESANQSDEQFAKNGPIAAYPGVPLPPELADPKHEEASVKVVETGPAGPAKVCVGL